jgi:hypothetical protein
MSETEQRATHHLSCARYHLGATDYSIKAAITELHKTGPRVEEAARLFRPLNQVMNGLHRLIKTMETHPMPVTTATEGAKGKG